MGDWKWKYYLLSHVQLFATAWIIAFQAPLPMKFSRQEYWSGLPFPSPRDLPRPRDRTSVIHIENRFFTIWATRELWGSIFFFLNTLFFICFSVTVSVSFVYLKDLPLAGNSESIFNVFSHHLDFVTLKLHPLAFVFFTNHKCEHWTICFRMTHCCCCCC